MEEKNTTSPNPKTNRSGGVGDLLDLLANKKNFPEVDPPHLREYWLSAEEYNLLIDSLKIWLDDYNRRIAEIDNPNTIPIIKSEGIDTPTDSNVFSALRTIKELGALGEVFDNRFLSKIYDDVAKGKLKFEDNVSFGNYRKDNEGAHISKYGDAEVNSLKARGWIETPEFRFNRVEVMMGEKWRAPGGGIIDHVEILSDNSGIITLKLEEGEYGAVAVNDLCTGIFHSLTDSNNSTTDYDNSKGSRRLRGFATCYFKVTRILDTKKNSRFEYVLRPASESHTHVIHPEKFAHFSSYGNTTNVNRQNSVYETRTYERYLINVNTWEYGFNNIASQYGDLSNMAVHGFTNMTGYSAYLNNVYFSGKLMKVHAPRIINGYWHEFDYDCGNPENNGCWRNTGTRAFGRDGNPPYIGENGNWWVWNQSLLEYVDSGDTARGDDGKSPEIRNGIWWVWDNEKQEWVTTGIRAEGTPGLPGKDANELTFLGEFTSPPEPIRNPNGGAWSFMDDEGILHPAEGCYYRSANVLDMGNVYLWRYSSWVLWLKDGTQGISPINVSITNENISIDKNNPNYSNTGTTLIVWEGTDTLTYSPSRYNNQEWGTYTVEREFIGINGGSLSTSNGNMVAGNASNMTTNSARIAYTVKGYRLEGKYFSFSKTQSFTKSGLDGVNSFTSSVFIRATTPPDTPTGGDYLEPIPTSLPKWTDGIPSGDDPVWISTRIFSNTGGHPQQPDWTLPQKTSDIPGLEFRFSSVKTNPGNPTSRPSNWSINPSPSNWWMAMRMKVEGIWESWKVTQIRGEDGKNGRDTEWIYTYSETQPPTPVGSNHGWSSTPDIVLNEIKDITVLDQVSPEGLFWEKFGSSYKSPSISHNEETKLKLGFTVAKAGDVTMSIKTSSSNSDYFYISELNATEILSTSYKDRISGINQKNVIFKNVPIGTHFVWVMYKKDGSGVLGYDAGYIEPSGYHDTIWISTRTNIDGVWSVWSTPKRFITDTVNEESIYSLSVDSNIPKIGGNANVDEFIPYPCLPGRYKGTFQKLGSYVAGDCVVYNNHYYTLMNSYNGAVSSVTDPGTAPEVFKYTYPWTDNLSGASHNIPYEYMAVRRRAMDGTWGEFSDPVLYSRFGKDGEEAGNIPIVVRGKWNSNFSYTGRADLINVVYVGEGEGRMYYSTKPEVNGTFQSSDSPESDTVRWKPFPHSYTAVASSLIVAEKANIGKFVIHDGHMVSQVGIKAGTSTQIDLETLEDVPTDFVPYIRLDGRDGTNTIINAGRVGGFNIANEILTSSDGSSLILNGKTGNITAVKGNIASFILANQTLTSQDKTGGSPNLSMNGKTGEFSALNATIRGSFESNSSGDRITINKTSGEIRGIGKDGKTMFSIGFRESSDSVWTHTSVFSLYTRGTGSNYMETEYSNSSLTFKMKNGAAEASSGTINSGGVNFGRFDGKWIRFSVNTFGPSNNPKWLTIMMDGLPENASSAVPGQLYREGNNLKIK